MATCRRQRLWPWPQWRAAYGHPLVTAGHRGRRPRV